MTFEARVREIVDSIVQDRQLPAASIFLSSNMSKRGTIASMSLCIGEPEYPSSHDRSTTQEKSYVIMNIRRKSSIEMLVKSKHLEAVCLPSDAVVNVSKSNEILKCIVFEAETESLFDFIRANIAYAAENFEPSNSFGCCSRFLECSNMRRCVHENRLYSKGCSYRRNLESGRIFYGVNRSID